MHFTSQRLRALEVKEAWEGAQSKILNNLHSLYYNYSPPWDTGVGGAQPINIHSELHALSSYYLNSKESELHHNKIYCQNEDKEQIGSPSAVCPLFGGALRGDKLCVD